MHIIINSYSYVLKIFLNNLFFKMHMPKDTKRKGNDKEKGKDETISEADRKKDR